MRDCNISPLDTGILSVGLNC